jgi:hypothetical protein
MIFGVQTTILAEYQFGKIETQNCEMVPIGTMPKNRDQLVSTGFIILVLAKCVR